MQPDSRVPGAAAGAPAALKEALYGQLVAMRGGELLGLEGRRSAAALAPDPDVQPRPDHVAERADSRAKGPDRDMPGILSVAAGKLALKRPSMTRFPPFEGPFKGPL